MKVSVVGAGQVGAASAFACLLQGICSELVMLDLNRDYAVAQAQDLLHAAPFSSPATVFGTDDYDDLVDSDVVVISAGVAQVDGETRIDLLRRNADVFRIIIPKILDVAPDAVLLIASNPVDVMTQVTVQIAQETHNIPSSRIIGSGTMLDTARFRALLAEHLGVSSHSVHAHVLGEHGDSEVLHWSGVQVSNMKLENFAVQMNSPITEAVKAEIDNGVRNAAYGIIKGKGATWFGIGAAIARMAEVIHHDERAVMTCSGLSADVAGVSNVCVSVPRVLGAGGIIKSIDPALTQDEYRSLNESAGLIKALVDSLLSGSYAK